MENDDIRNDMQAKRIREGLHDVIKARLDLLISGIVEDYFIDIDEGAGLDEALIQEYEDIVNRIETHIDKAEEFGLDLEE